MSAVTPPSGDRAFPPVAWLTTGALTCAVIGGILMASYAPRKAPLGVATALLVLGIALLGIAAGLLSHLKDFAWPTFNKVFKWALLLVVFGVSVPSTIAFTVARYADA